VLLLAAFAGCGIGESGIPPPNDRIFFPAGLAVSPGDDWLYVVNSNSDLRYNAGTVVAVDLRKAAEDRAPTAQWPACPSNRFVPPADQPPRFCCHDFIDSKAVNCDERGYIAANASVRIGSFGGDIVEQTFTRAGAPAQRLFVAVRAEPSITVIDVTTAGNQINLHCTDPSKPVQAFPTCDDTAKIRERVDETGVQVLQLQEEPHSMVLDDKLGVLYVAHLGAIEHGMAVIRGVSTIDVCHPEVRTPQLNAVLQDAAPRSGSLGVTDIMAGELGNPNAPLYATAQFTADVAEVLFRDPARVSCELPPAVRDLTMVAGKRFTSSVYGTRGGDLRGMSFSPDRNVMFILHRQYADRRLGEYNPPSVVAVDRRPDPQGDPVNRPVGFVEVCNGPTKMVAHDAGRGNRLFINCFEGGQLYIVDPNLLAVEAVIEVGAGPADLVFPHNDPSLAYVAGFANNNVAVVDLKPGSPTEYRVVQRIGFARTAGK
jgi:DNA-binding beta-propeller fold protein YncE